MFLLFLFFDLNIYYFAKAIAHAKAVAFLRFSQLSYMEYWAFCPAFFAKNKSNVLEEWFSHVFGIFNFFTSTYYFAKAIAHAKGIAFLDGRFSNESHLLNIWCFVQRFFAWNNSNVLAELFFCMFLAFLILDRI